jgi:hypothetical protein
VLRDGTLPQAQHRLEVADTLLAVPQNAEDSNACRMAQGAKKISLFSVRSKDLG